MKIFEYAHSGHLWFIVALNYKINLSLPTESNCVVTVDSERFNFKSFCVLKIILFLDLASTQLANRSMFQETGTQLAV